MQQDTQKLFTYKVNRCTTDNYAEELIQLFSHVRIPDEILTEQGSNFTSQLLTQNAIIYLPNQQTPYHPHTDDVAESKHSRKC